MSKPRLALRVNARQILHQQNWLRLKKFNQLTLRLKHLFLRLMKSLELHANHAPQMDNASPRFARKMAAVNINPLLRNWFSITWSLIKSKSANLTMNASLRGAVKVSAAIITSFLWKNEVNRVWMASILTSKANKDDQSSMNYINLVRAPYNLIIILNHLIIFKLLILCIIYKPCAKLLEILLLLFDNNV